MEIPDELLCLFSTRIDRRDGSYVIEVPAAELRRGTLSDGGTYRVALLPGEAGAEPDASEPDRHRDTSGPPVEEGEHRTVEIDALGEQGDGIARVERGYVVIVPDTERGERVEIEITDVRRNVSFGRVVERVSYYD